MSPASSPPVRVDVVIPCHNAERFLAAAIESVLEQEVENLRVIVVDDGSTDRSAAVVRAFGTPVEYHVQPHGGAAAARNTGVQLATADLLAFLDADDLWTPGSLARRLAALDQHSSVDGVFGMVEQFLDAELPPSDVESIRHDPRPQAVRLIGTMLVRRASFLRVGLFDPGFAVGETIDWCARADAMGMSFSTIPHVVLRRRIHRSNLGRQEQSQRRDYLRVLKSALDRRNAATHSAANQLAGENQIAGENQMPGARKPAT